MKCIAFITNIAKDNVSGGFSAMNRSMLEFLMEGHTVDYIGPVNPKPDLRQHVLSKVGRVLGVGGDFFYFSEQRLEAIRKNVEARLDTSKAELAVFHGFTPWISTRPALPYIAWCDCTFWQYVHIYHDASSFRASDLERIKEREIAWLRKAERVIFRSAWAASDAVRDYHLDAARVGVVKNCGSITPQSGHCYEGGRDFVMVETNFLQKGGPIAVEAFREVRKVYRDARLIIVGDRPGWRILREPRVVYLGWVDKSNPEQREILRQTLSKARCLVHPTTADINPTVLIEAGYFGCPAISTKRFAIPELVLDGSTGLLLDDPTDVSSVVDAMFWMLRQNERYLRMREEARVHMLKCYARDTFQIRLRSQLTLVENVLRSRVN